jgi:2OG-Fe(II) oxygenase superfamily
MHELRDLSLGTFLPLARMRDLASAGGGYASAMPYPHIVLEDFFDTALVDVVLGEFPAPGQMHWRGFENQYEVKLFSTAEETFGPVTRLLLYHLNSITFLEFLSQITGIPNLMPDPTFNGGGMHQIQRGGKLGIHADFNRHKKYGLDRRLNLLLYLNKDWEESYGGHLELWDQEMKGCQKKILPIFNRVVIFSTTDFSYHGHPDPLQCPEGMTRKSLAMYYYTNGRPKSEVSKAHSTIFRERREGEFGQPSLRKRVSAALRKIRLGR